MSRLKTIRIILATIFLVATLALLIIGPRAGAWTFISIKTQIIPSALATTAGATAFWLILSLICGRIYCSTVCPIGAAMTLIIPLRRKKFSFRPSAGIGWTIFIAYIACIVIGITAAAWILEPWNILASATAAIRPENAADTWGTITINSPHTPKFLADTSIALLIGIASGIVSFAGLMIWTLISGRIYCTDICPIGTALGAVSQFSLYHIDIDPDKCINCMKCEEICQAGCIQVKTRQVDNARCLRCFDCLKACPNDAIRLQRHRNRRQTPLMMTPKP